MGNFQSWVLDNECLLKDERFKPFMDNCLYDTNLFKLETEKDFFYYLTVNGYSEEIILAFLRLFHVYQTVIK